MAAKFASLTFMSPAAVHVCETRVCSRRGQQAVLSPVGNDLKNRELRFVLIGVLASC